MGKTIQVANATQLSAAIKAMTGGETVLLAPGNYGAVTIANKALSAPVTFRSADPNNDAVLKTLKVSSSSNLRFEDIDIRNPLAPGQSDWTQAVYVDRSKSIAFNGIDMLGSLDGNVNNDGWGIRFTNSSNVMVANSNFQQLKVALVFTDTDAITVADNKISEVREGMNFAATHHVLIENNAITKIIPNWAAGDHPDAIQFWNTNETEGNTDVVIRNNTMMFDSGSKVQGIFVGLQLPQYRHADFVIENNLYHGDQLNAILVQGIDNLVIRNNSMVTRAGAFEAGITVERVTNATITDNIAAVFGQSRSTGVVMADNVDTWDKYSKKGVALAGLFNDTSPGVLDQHDFGVAAGSAAAKVGAGFKPMATIGLGTAAPSLDLAYVDYSHVFNGNPATMHLV